jgi:hypothetical protein
LAKWRQQACCCAFIRSACCAASHASKVSSKKPFPPFPGLFAIEILCQCPGGAWRTLSEWEDIFGSQGFALADNTRVGCNMNLMVFSKREA